LLNPSRIRAMTSDVGRHICRYHDDAIAKDVSKTEMDIARKRCLAGLCAIVPHHCGDHSKCDASFCLYLQIKEEVSNKMDPDSVAFILLVNKEYAEHSRFGFFMQLDDTGIAVATKNITSRIDEKNIDRIAQKGCSNGCELFFGNMTKVSEGKRLNWTVNFDKYVDLVAGLRSNPTEFSNKLEAELGYDAKTDQRQKYLERKETNREHRRIRRQSEGAKETRMAKKQVTLRNMEKDGKSSNRHKTDKVHPKE
jgi:hypothetical protein